MFAWTLQGSKAIVFLLVLKRATVHWWELKWKVNVCTIVKCDFRVCCSINTGGDDEDEEQEDDDDDGDDADEEQEEDDDDDDDDDAAAAVVAVAPRFFFGCMLRQSSSPRKRCAKNSGANMPGRHG